jgi:hypothetical protein
MNRRLLMAFALLWSDGVTCQPLIMGHRVGETVLQFLEAEPHMQGQLESCRRDAPKPLTPQQIDALSKEDAYVLSQQVYTTYAVSPSAHFPFKKPPSRGQMAGLARQGWLLVLDRRMPDVIASCTAVIQLNAPASIVPFVVRSDRDARPYPMTWRFQSGTLLQIDIDFRGGEFAAIEADMTAKTGIEPIAKKQTETPNLYGGIVAVSRMAMWLTPDTYAVLVQDEKLVDGQMHLLVTSRKQYDTWANSHTVKSALD